MARKTPAKELLVKLIVGAGQASPSPPVGPALGSKGVKSMDFCKEFNALTAGFVPGTPIPALVTVRPDRSFYFSLRTPPTATLLLAAAGVEKGKGGRLRGANAPGRSAEGSVNANDPSTRTMALAGSSQTRGGGSLPAGRNSSHSAGGGVGEGVVKMVAKAAGGDKAVGFGGGSTQVGAVSLKHVFEIARIKQSEPRLAGMSLEGLARSVVGQARSTLR